MDGDKEPATSPLQTAPGHGQTEESPGSSVSKSVSHPSDIIVRCRDGHLFTTIWLPLVSIKAVRFPGGRFQRCPVGRHWTCVRPVTAPELAELSPEELQQARAIHDVRLP